MNEIGHKKTVLKTKDGYVFTIINTVDIGQIYIKAVIRGILTIWERYVKESIVSKPESFEIFFIPNVSMLKEDTESDGGDKKNTKEQTSGFMKKPYGVFFSVDTIEQQGKFTPEYFFFIAAYRIALRILSAKSLGIEKEMQNIIASQDAVEALKAYMDKHGIKDIFEIKGKDGRIIPFPSSSSFELAEVNDISFQKAIK